MLRYQSNIYESLWINYKNKMDDQPIVNPISIARCLLETVQREFPAFGRSDQITDAEQQIANLLFEKFGKITLKYEFVEDFENDTGQWV